MEFHNRRLLLLNEDVPISPFPRTEPMTPPSSPPPPPMYVSSLQLPPRPIFAPNLAYAFLILFTTLFFLGFILLYIRQFSDNSSSLRRHRSSGDAAADTKPLPTVPYRGDSTPQQAECAICLDEFLEGETVKMIPHCKHVFHPECIDTWLVDHVTCPVCRRTKVCEVGKAECGSVENREEGGSEGELEGALSESTRRGSGGGGGSRFRLRRSLSF